MVTRVLFKRDKIMSIYVEEYLYLHSFHLLGDLKFKTVTVIKCNLLGRCRWVFVVVGVPIK